MTRLKRPVKIVIIALLLIPLPLIGLALSNYWRESHLPIFDVKRDKLYALHRPGSGQKILMLHGLAASSAFWEQVIDKLPQDMEILAPDLLGFGESPKPSANYDLKDQVAALEALLTDKGFTDGDGVTVVAHSMGTLVGMALIADRPKLFDRAIFISTPYYPDEASAKLNLANVSMMHKGVVNGSLSTKIMCYTFHGHHWPNLGRFFGLPDEVFNAGTQHTWESLSNSLNNSVINEDVPRLLAQLKLPLTFIHGDKDRVAPLENVRRLLVDYSSTSLIVVDNSDHGLPLQHPNRIVDAVLNVSRH